MRLVCRILLLIVNSQLLLLSGQPVLFGRTARNAHTQVASIKVKTEVVNFTVSVTDQQQHAVPGLERTQFEVFEDKSRQQIAYFKVEDAPLSVGIIFDHSGSMKGKLKQSHAALQAFIDTCHKDDDFFLVGFNHQVDLLADFTDGDALVSRLGCAEARGNTALYDAVYLGIEKVKLGRHRKRVLLIISDGEDNKSHYAYGELRKLLKEAEVQVYCLGIGVAFSDGDFPAWSRIILEEIARLTGGRAFFPNSAAELEEIAARISLELRQQYSLGYISSNEQRDGRWRRLRVRVTPPPGMSKLTVRAKAGYYAANGNSE
ncbi:MAG: VWA domain-containing protein [Acidobacteria bacterium]|nr:VWA domain-containing protein [Acidobacteriota bacterium]